MKGTLKLAVAAILAAFIMASQNRACGQGGATTTYYLTSFSPSIAGALWIFGGDCPTNLQSISGDPPVYQTADVRDSSMIEIDHNFYVVFNDEQTNSCRIVVSPDLVNWSDYATIFVPTEFCAFWSPKFVTDDAGTIYLTAFVQNAADQNYYMGVGLMTSDLTELYDFNVMYLSNNPASGLTDPNSSAVYLHNGVYYLFTGDGNEYTASDILANQWTLLEQGLVYGAGKTVAEWNGMFYMTASELGSQDWDMSSDLTNWTALNLPDAVTPQLGTIGREGCFITVTTLATVSADNVQLQLANVGGKMVLRWPDSGAYTLLQSPSLSPPSWTANTDHVLTVNGTNLVSVTSPGNSMYYRLSQ